MLTGGKTNLTIVLFGKLTLQLVPLFGKEGLGEICLTKTIDTSIWRRTIKNICRSNSKYKKSFDSYEKDLHAARGKEDFEKENDLEDWEFAGKALIWWEDKLRALRNA